MLATGHRSSDEFMDSFLRILTFDDYPCLTHVQYDFLSYMGCPSRAHRKLIVTARNDRKMVVFDGLTMESASYSNKWKEKLILNELSNSMSNIVDKYRNVRASKVMYAIRVIGTQFTFYKATADEKHIEEAFRSPPPIKCKPIFQRHPPVRDSMYLNAYDFCNIGDRNEILMSMAAIHRFLTKD